MSERLEKLRQSMEVIHACKATHAASVPIHEMFGQQVIGEEEVMVFDLIGHPKASMDYAWAYDMEADSRMLPVLQSPPIISSVNTVRAAIVGDLRQIERN